MASEYYNDQSYPFQIALTNLGKYNEGELAYTWLQMPCDPADFDSALKEIGIGECDEFGQPYEEVFVSDYEIAIEGVTWEDLGGEYPNYDNLNVFASAMAELDEEQYERFAAIAESGYDRFNLAELYSLAKNIDDHEVFCWRDCKDDYDLGYAVAEEYGLPDNDNYFDYEKYGKSLNDEGRFFPRGNDMYEIIDLKIDPYELSRDVEKYQDDIASEKDEKSAKKKSYDLDR